MAIIYCSRQVCDLTQKTKNIIGVCCPILQLTCCSYTSQTPAVLNSYQEASCLSWAKSLALMLPFCCVWLISGGEVSTPNSHSSPLIICTCRFGLWHHHLHCTCITSVYPATVRVVLSKKFTLEPISGTQMHFQAQKYHYHVRALPKHNNGLLFSVEYVSMSTP